MDQQPGTPQWARAEGTQPVVDVWEQASLEEDQGRERVSGPLSLSLLDSQMAQPGQLAPVQTPPLQRRRAARPRRGLQWSVIFVVIVLSAVCIMPLLSAHHINGIVVSSPPTYTDQTQTESTQDQPTETQPTQAPTQTPFIIPTVPTFSETTVVPTVSGAFAEFPITPGSNPYGMTLGPDGAIWFTLQYSNQIGRITPDGHLEKFGVRGLVFNPTEITVGPDKAIWFVQGYSNNQLGHLSNGSVSVFEGASSAIANLAAADGYIWFTEPASNKIGRVSTQTFQEYTLPTPDSEPLGITKGSDGNLWFTEHKGGKIGRITPGGVITEFPLPPGSTGPETIITGADTSLWFIEPLSARIVRMTTMGAMQNFPLPFVNGSLPRLTVGADDSIWFTNTTGNKIGYITPSGSLSEYPVPTLLSGVVGIAADAQGTIWFTEFNSNQIGEFKPNG